MRVIFGYLTLIVSDAPEGLGDVVLGFRSPVTAAMSQSEWTEVGAKPNLEAVSRGIRHVRSELVSYNLVGWLVRLDYTLYISIFI